MKNVFKVTVRFDGTCEFWFDAAEVPTKEAAEKEAIHRIYNGEIGQYFKPIDVNVREVEQSQIRDEFFTN